jgi:transposase
MGRGQTYPLSAGPGVRYAPAAMYLRCHRRVKDGKEHRYWSIEEKHRCADGRAVDRRVLYLGEINDGQQASWLRCIEAIEEGSQRQLRLALFPADRAIPAHAAECGVQVRLGEFTLERPRQWGACWLVCHLWAELPLERFWQPRLAPSREGTSWYHVLMVLVAYRLLAPGSEWRLHREWYQRSAMGDLLGEDVAVVAKDTLYRCLDKVVGHKDALFTFLTSRWQDLFGVTYDVLLYDLTSTYFESDPPVAEEDKRRYGYSRDRRPDCVQVVIALIVTPEGFPLAYEVLPGNTADHTTLPTFLAQIEARYGQARRIGVMDRGIPTEAHLAALRARGAQYIVGTPKGRLTQLEQAFLRLPWREARPSVQVQLRSQEAELYVWVQSERRVTKERAMRRRRLKRLWARLRALQEQRPTYETLLLKLGAAKKEAGRVWALVRVELPAPPPKAERARRVDFTFALDRAKLRRIRRREGRYLLRSNLTETDPARLWEFYLQLVEVEAAFKDLKGDLAVRPISHQVPPRIEAHIFVAFLAYCLHVTLRAHLRPHAAGLTVRQVLDTFAAMQLLDVHFPTTDGRELIFTRHTEPEPDQLLLLAQLGWTLPAQPPPRITAKRAVQM